MSTTTANMSIGAEGLLVRQTDATAAALRRVRDRVLTASSSSQASKGEEEAQSRCIDEPTRTHPTRDDTAEGVSTSGRSGGLDDDPGGRSDGLRAEAARYADADAVPFRLLQRVCEALRAAGGGDPGGGAEGMLNKVDDDGVAGGTGGPWLQDLVRGGGVALEPPRRPPRNPELEARCQKLRDEMARREYEEMTKDVTGRRRGEASHVSALTRDLGFVAHVITVVIACFAGGVVTGRSFAPDSLTPQVVLGAVGGFIALIVEALLFMLREGKT